VFLAAVLLYSYAFRGGESFLSQGHVVEGQFPATQSQDAIIWIRANTLPNDVFLTSEGSCLSLVGPAGRKCVLTRKSFSNPYVDWNLRQVDHQAMWDSLTSGDCGRFSEYARAYAVSYVMAVEGETPQLRGGPCSTAATTLQGATLQIYRLTER